jgi:hypothetical protein
MTPVPPIAGRRSLVRGVSRGGRDARRVVPRARLRRKRGTLAGTTRPRLGPSAVAVGGAVTARLP